MAGMGDHAAEVVISGISGRFPESDNIAEFRKHLINGDDMVTEDDRRWKPGQLECYVLLFRTSFIHHKWFLQLTDKN